MSVIFGIRKEQGEGIEERQLLDLAGATDRYAPDGTFLLTRNQVGMGFQAYHTHQRSNLESQPAVGRRGDMVTLDGRLDNHKELCNLLEIRQTAVPDSHIVLAAFERWGEDCFSRLLGDWALALWSESTQTLYLARDHAGTRTLYFEVRNNTVVWATFLETFFVKERGRKLDETYAACYLGCQPLRDLTPYRGITSVTPAHFVGFSGTKLFRRAHWQAMSRREVRYRTDAEYEEHFFQTFQLAVKRRIGSGAPIVAQLSGGIDSASIVSMADHLRGAKVHPASNLLDTISFYDESEPDWNERPYFSRIEEARGRRGIHVQVSFGDRSISIPDPAEGEWLLPGYDRGRAETFKAIHKALLQGCFRSVVSGIGGDELLGGVPTPLPELADHLAALRLRQFVDRSIKWSLDSRTPLVQTMWAATSFAFNLYRTRIAGPNTFPPWVSGHLCQLGGGLQKSASGQIESRSLNPSSIASGFAWWSMLETLPNLHPTPFDRREYRYPYLDRDLVDYLLSIPREQLVRPGQRRSLMRRSLREIVPNAVLNRRRKAIVSRGPLRFLERCQKEVEELFRESLLGSLGWIDDQRLLADFRRLLANRDPTWSLPLLNAVGVELWLQSRNVSHQTKC